ncbi:MAG: DUF1501 domain-containing protein [Planctomycetota bacterium]|nr:DUF1501 domain-containing protein [Planctomycetota bacterium]MEC7450785.1 DUF1501 domain-containing protein [Planctomycetota bacterium]MEC7718650.1 DUF1501 domain-containing protein [Planctomycetota bacterium]MED5287485.1 DUF1501 domain-containing protein [Planctomycetota bacterium]
MTIFRNCEGITRRNCLQLGLGGLVGAGLSPLLRGRALADVGVKRQQQADACILVWLDGGPTHYETFDPKPEAPVEIRGEFGTTPTAVPGTHFSEHMVNLAGIFDKYSLIRSIRHDQGNHGAGNHYMMTGAPPRIPVGCGAFVSFHPSLGSVVAKEVGAPDGLPPYFSMPSMSRSGGPNFLGANYAPFVVSNDPNRTGFRVRDVALPDGVLHDRFNRRRELRSQLDQLPRWEDSAVGDPSVTADEFYLQGYQLMESAQAQAAFRVETEEASLRDRYGRNSFGQRALLARRLVEAGVPFVTLYEGGWDHHTNIFDAISKRIPPLESTIATLIQDLEDRGRLERTLVLVLGEFGRTPKVNDRGGRDHWSNAMSVMMAGGGTPGGQVVGATDRQGYSAVERVLSPERFVSTIYAKLGIDPGKIYITPDGRPVHLVSDDRPIEELMA